MAIIYVISIKNIISTELSQGKEAKHFFEDELPNIVVKHILVDFSDVNVITGEFAYQYLDRKHKIKDKKMIREVNKSESICKVFIRVQKEIDKNSKEHNENKNRKKELSIITNPAVSKKT